VIYSYAAILHGVMAGLCLVSSAYLYGRKENHPAAKNYFNWFFLYTFFNLSLVLPLIVFDELNIYTGYFYAIALFFLGLAAWQAFKTALNFIGGFPKKYASIIYLIGVMAVTALHFIYPEIPMGSADGKWVFWYPRSWISLLYVAFMFVAGWTFFASFLRGMRGISPVLKLRALLFSSGAFLLPLAAYYYFGAAKISDIYLAFIFAIGGLFLFAAGNMIGLFKKG